MHTQSKKILLPVILFFFTFFGVAHAAPESLSITITPPLYQLNVSPGEEWQSSLKIVNNNAYTIVVYASLMDFTADGEGGSGKFLPVGEIGHPASSLAKWLTISTSSITIAPEQSMLVPFALHVPVTAEPGGHYGAIMIGTAPPPSARGVSISVSSMLTSLMLVRVSGNVVEKGDIREFSTEKSFYQEPKATFTLRFENKGNVHLLPQGDITIYNMWGKKRGKIDVNQQTDFGNVLPNSIRKFSFEWVGESNFFDVGRYTAIATLAYGDNGKQNTYRAVTFWVVPIIPAIELLGSLLVFVWFMLWAIRAYIRRALALERQNNPSFRPADPAVAKEASVVVAKESATPLRVLTRPIVEGAVDLRRVQLKSVDTHTATKTGVAAPPTLGAAEFLKKYSLFFLALIVFAIGIMGIVSYFRHVLVKERSYHINIKHDDGAKIPITSKQ